MSHSCITVYLQMHFSKVVIKRLPQTYDLLS